MEKYDRIKIETLSDGSLSLCIDGTFRGRCATHMDAMEALGFRTIEVDELRAEVFELRAQLAAKLAKQ